MTTILPPGSSLPDDWIFNSMTEVDSAPGWDTRARLETLPTEQVGEALLAFVASGFGDEAVIAEEVLSERRRGRSPMDDGEIADAAEVARAWRERPFDSPAEAAEADPLAPGPWWRDVPDLEAEPMTMPGILNRTDGAPVVPAGRLTSIYGRPAAGKSWAALATIVAALRGGRRAVFWDFEGTVIEAYKRLRQLGAYRAPGEGLAGSTDRFRYAPGLALGQDRVGEAAAFLGAEGLVVVDSVGRAGGATDSGREYYEWHCDHVLPFRAAGASVVLVDHVSKHVPKGGRPAGALGSQARFAEVDVGLLAEGQPWTRQASGAVRLTLEKDRYGDTGGRAGEILAVVRGGWHGDAFALSVDPPEATERGEPSEAEALERDVVAAVLVSGGYGSTVKLAQAVGRRKEDVAEVARRASERGAIRRVETGRGVRYEPPSEPEPEADPEPEALL